MKRIKTWLDSLSTKAILYKLDKRRKVQESDNLKLHSLFQSEDSVQNLTANEIQKAVDDHISGQLLRFARELHQFLEVHKDAVPFTKQASSIPDHIVFPDQMTLDLKEKTDLLEEKFKPKLSLEQISSMFKKQFGYSLHVARSSVSHPGAGDGLWIKGEASSGDVVALFPGITYAPIHYKEMLGYPKIDEDNSYLITRFDGIIIDSKPWGHGLYEEQFEGKFQTFAEVYELEGRHPLAFGHFANHPEAGVGPNVLLAPFDVTTSIQTRPYIPNIKCCGDYAILEQTEKVSGLVLVAARVLKNEELFVNYRLNPHMIRPKWYTPVDEKEDLMRWS